MENDDYIYIYIIYLYIYIQIYVCVFGKVKNLYGKVKESIYCETCLKKAEIGCIEMHKGFESKDHMRKKRT